MIWVAVFEDILLKNSAKKLPDTDIY